MENATSIPTSLQMLLRDLAFLSQITRGVKPCIKSRELVKANSWWDAFYRFYKGENRSIVISEIERIFGQCVEAIETHKNTDHIRIIIEYANNAYNGVNTLNSTYHDDPDILSRLNVILKNLEIQLNNFRHMIRGYEDEKKEENTIDLCTSEEKRGKYRFKKSSVESK